MLINHKKRVLHTLVFSLISLFVIECSSSTTADAGSNSNNNTNNNNTPQSCSGIPAPLPVYSLCPGTCPAADDSTNTSYTYNGNLLVSFSFDFVGMLSTVNYSYDAAGNLTQVQNTTFNTTTTYTYTGGKLTTRPSSTYTYIYTWGANGLVSSFESWAAGTHTTTNTLTYDSCNRLVQQDSLDIAGNATTTYKFNYDGSNRLSSETRNGIQIRTYGYDANGRLSSDGGSNYTYDANGNLINDGVVNYTYAPGDTDGRPTWWYIDERYLYGQYLGN